MWTLKLICLVSFLGTLALAEEQKSWSWGLDTEADIHDLLVAEETSVYPPVIAQKPNATNEEVEDVIETILSSTRQGRNIEGFDEVYKDPNVKQALDSGDDTQARNIIKDRLCSLGLMQCDGESVDPKRYVSPEDLIYAQPVNIQPVGRPVPSIPVRGPPRAYGPARPVPINGPPPPFGPPRKVGYAGPRPGPQYASSKYGPSYGGPPSFSGNYDGPYLTKPPSSGSIYEGAIIDPEIPYEFEKAPIKGIKGSASSHSLDISAVQQHVHHHYHHGEGGKQPAIIVNNPVPVASETHLHGTSAIVTGGYQASSGNGFSPIDPGFNGNKNQYGGVKPVYEGTAPGLSSGLYNNNNKYNQNSAGVYNAQNQQNTAGVYNLGYASGSGYNPSGGANLNSYSQSTQFYKKELNTNPNLGNNNYLDNGNYYGNGNQYSSQFGYDKFKGQESGRAENFDCVCVPYDQCPSENVIGRKDDLFLPIDPRNLPKDIEALADEKVVITDGNGTMSVVRVPKMVANENVTATAKNETEKKISKRETNDKASDSAKANIEPRQAFYQPQQQQQQQCGPRHVCCRKQYRPQIQQQLVQQQGPNRGQCGSRHSQGINGRIKNPVYVDGDSEFGEYPWQAAILKKDPKESVYVCGGTLIDHLHIMTAAHCVKTFTGFDLRVRLGEWDVNHDVEFYPYIERDVVSVHIHPQYYAGTLDNDLAILKLDHPVDWTKYPHISPACLPDKYTDYTGTRCWTTGWGKDAFGDFGKYQNILKEVDVPIIGHNQCQAQLRQTRLGYQYQLNPGFICAGGEEGKDACKGDGGGPMVCERGGTWQLVGVVSWGIGCGQVNVPGVYVKVAHYLDWIAQITGSGRY